MLPVSNMLTLLDGQTNRFSLPTHHYSSISAVEDVGGHPEIMVKCTSPNFNATPTNHDHDHHPNIWERQWTRRSWEGCQQFNKSCLHQLFKKKPNNNIVVRCERWCQSGGVYSNYCTFHKLFQAKCSNSEFKNFLNKNKKTPIEACLMFSISKLLFISALICSKGQQNKSWFSIFCPWLPVYFLI